MCIGTVIIPNIIKLDIEPDIFLEKTLKQMGFYSPQLLQAEFIPKSDVFTDGIEDQDH